MSLETDQAIQGSLLATDRDGRSCPQLSGTITDESLDAVLGEWTFYFIPPSRHDALGRHARKSKQTRDPPSSYN